MEQTTRSFFVVLMLILISAIAAMGQTVITQASADTTGVQTDAAVPAGTTDVEVDAFNQLGAKLATVRASISATIQANTVTRVTVPASSLPTGFNVTLKAAAGKKDATGTVTWSQPSAPASVVTVPAPPTNISGIGGLNKVTVQWTNVQGATSYQLTLSNGMSFVVPASTTTCTTGTCTSYTVTGLQTATSYNVIVAGITAAGGRGIFSPAVAVRTANIALQ